MSTRLVSRRSVTRGAAWAAPIVAVGVAAPAYAASSNPVSVTAVTVCQCAGGGVKKYSLTATFSNPTTHSFALTNLVVGEVSGTITNQTPTTGAVTAGPGTTQLTFYFNRGNNAANGTFSITYTAQDNNTSFTYPPATFTTPTAIPATTSCLVACP